MSRLLVVGWDAADWKVIQPLLDKGEMPNLARLMREGVSGNLATIFPALSPMVWTSIATGKRAYKHGIYGFTEPSDDGLSVRPISNLGRKTKAFWNILNQEGKRSLVVGWWPSHPAEPIRGVMVSNHFPTTAEPAPVPAGTVSPPEWAERLADLRVAPDEMTGGIIRFFVPEFEKIDQKTDRSLADLATIVAETMSIHAAATELIEHVPWDLAAVYFNGIDHFSHRFMQYHAGKVRRPDGTDSSIFAGVVANGYRYHDVMLGRLLALAGEDCAVMVLSDHGFHSDGLLPDYIPAEGAGPAVEHRDLGIFCLRAPGVRRGERIYGASVLDIAPTVLHLFGLPAGLDMDGKVLVNAFTDPALPAPIPSWDDVPGDDGRHPPSRQYDAAASAEALRQLVDLGYIAPPGENAARAVGNCMAELRYHKAESLFGGGLYHKAIPILREILAEDGEQARCYRLLIDCYLMRGEMAAARQVLDAFDATCARFVPQAAAELERRRQARPAESPMPDPKSRELFEWRELAEKSRGYHVDRLILRIRMELADPASPDARDGTRRLIEELAKAAGRRSGPALFLAQVYASIGEPDRALQYIRRARRADRDGWQAMALEAHIHFTAGRYEKAVASAVDSLALVYFQPAVQTVLGAAQRRLGRDAEAEQALRVALSQSPGFVPAHEELGHLLRREVPRIGEAGLHLAQAQVARRKSAARRPEPVPASETPLTPGGFDRFTAPPADRSRVVTIVAGLPRSGTSMMMQMLAAASIEPYTDGRRGPDEDNPRGYLEHENATRLHQDAAWLQEARGRAVKVVASLLPHLPQGEEYRIVLMLRHPQEIVTSQQAMLTRLGKRGAAMTPERLIRTYSGQLVRLRTWLNGRPDVQVLGVDYGQALEDPAGTAARLAAFLGEPFDCQAAARCIEPSLRRQYVAAGRA
jgi:predicted AlkP superfamily phosphohydrolase/phosphomutase/tetratricopeptide (TPR) repeat protein